RDGAAKLWQLPEGNQPDFLKNEKNISSIYFSPDGKWLATRNSDYTYKLWQLPEGTQYDFLKNEKNISSIYFSLDGKWLLSVSHHVLTIRDLQKGEVVEKIWLSEQSGKIIILASRWLIIQTS